jgi:hypothetical protein
MTPARSTHSKRLATCRRSFSAAKPVACAVLTDIGRLPAAKCTLARGLSVYRSWFLAATVVAGEAGWSGFRWAGFPASPGPGMKDWP